MSSFLFITFFVYVFRCLGLHFQPFLFQTRSSDGFYLCRTSLNRSLTRLQQGLFRVALVSFPTLPKKRKQGFTGRVVVLCSKTRLPLPLKGEGPVFAQLWVLRFAGLAHNCPTRLLQCGEPASLVSVPILPSKPHTGLHRGEFGFIVFSWCASFAEVSQAGTPGGS